MRKSKHQYKNKNKSRISNKRKNKNSILILIFIIILIALSAFYISYRICFQPNSESVDISSDNNIQDLPYLINRKMGKCYFFLNSPITLR